MAALRVERRARTLAPPLRFVGAGGAILFLHDYISNQQSDRDRRMQAEARAAGIRSLGDDDLGPDSNDAVNAARAGQEPLARAAAAGAGPETNSKPQSEGNNNTSVLQALKFISSQSQIRCLAVMAVCQGVATNLLEVTWKGARDVAARVLGESLRATRAMLGAKLEPPPQQGFFCQNHGA